MRHRAIGVDQLEDGARDEGSENRLQSELFREHDECSEQEKRAADTDLRRCVLQAENRG